MQGASSQCAGRCRDDRSPSLRESSPRFRSTTLFQNPAGVGLRLGESSVVTHMLIFAGGVAVVAAGADDQVSTMTSPSDLFPPIRFCDTGNAGPSRNVTLSGKCLRIAGLQSLQIDLLHLGEKARHGHPDRVLRVQLRG